MNVVDHSEVTSAPTPASGSTDAAELDRRVRTDALTGLASKVQLVEWLDGAALDVPLALIDLDDFRLLNQSLGHDVGDETLRLVGRRLDAAFADSGRRVARLSQDEFAVLVDLPGAAADELAHRIASVFREPFSIDGRTFRVRATCGIGRTEAQKEANDVIREADTAMYEAKSQAKGRSLVFDPSFHRRAAEAFEMVEGLRHAVADGTLHLHYQPELDLVDGRVVAAEALMRWTHPVLGSIPPTSFIPVAEAAG